VLPPGLLVVHDTGRGGEDDVAELTRGQQLDDPLLHVAELDVVAGGDDAGLVDAAVELDDDLAVAVVVHLLELADVACVVTKSVMWRRNKHQTSWIGFRRCVSSPPGVQSIGHLKDKDRGVRDRCLVISPKTRTSTVRM
jgi:hypothetical protein